MVVLVFYVLVAVASISLNGLVILLWLRYEAYSAPDRLSVIISSRFSSLKAKPNNLFVVSLSLSGLLMMSKLPIFLLNLYHGGPQAGHLGAQVLQGLSRLVSPEISELISEC